MQRFWESITIALSSLVTNKLRSILTLVGMIIGVMTVIAVVSVINGMNSYVADEINKLGSSTFFVDKYGIIRSADEWYEKVKRKDLTLMDMRAVESHCEDCMMVGGSSYDTDMTIKRGSNKVSGTTVQGVTHNYIEVTDVEIASGRTLAEFDNLHRRAVAVVGPDVTDNLFPGEDPIGQKIKIGGYYFNIIGVAKRRGSFLGANQDNWALVPLSAFFKYFTGREHLQIFVKAVSFSKLEDAMDEVRVILRARHHVKYDEPDDFDIMTTETFMDLYNNFTRVAWIVLIGVSSISLVVGGIVIMNIMLVAVTERTREVGIRKAMGARRKDILWQFLVEALTISIVGGIIGILIGFGIATIISKATPLPSSVKLWSILLGVGISTTIGTFFGIYPAMKAARLDPIDALRYE